jgi:hypothetical protein
MAALSLIPEPSHADLITSGCASASSCTVAELGSGASFRMGDVYVSNWSVKTSSFDLTGLTIQFGGTPSSAEMDLVPTVRVLTVSNYSSASMTFAFEATGLDGVITNVEPRLGVRAVSGYSWDSPVIWQSTLIGTSPGTADLGTINETYTLYGPSGGGSIDVPDRKSVWVTTTYGLSANSGYAEGGTSTAMASAVPIGGFS